jgi:hypothetical protein
MIKPTMKVGQVKAWLDQGPAVLMGKCAPDLMVSANTRWVIYLLQTGNVISVPETTLHNGER